MIRRRALASVVVAALAACGARTPAPLDVAALVRARGPIEARRELELRVIAEPKDVRARLGLALLAEQQQRPSSAIEQLEAVRALGGPLGTRWRDADRARLARLVAARGRARLVRQAPTAHADLVRAKELGADVRDDELRAALAERALGDLRQVDGELRARGKRTLAELATAPGADPRWRGARGAATVEERGLYGAWLWEQGARRAAWEELAAWHAATRIPRDSTLAARYLEARAWWTPLDGPPPPVDDLVGPTRCRADGACAIADVVGTEPIDEAALRELLVAPPTRATDPDAAGAWLVATLVLALRGEAAWGPAFAARVELPAIATTALEPALRGAFARLAGRPAAPPARLDLERLTAGERLVVAAGRALDGGDAATVRAALGPLADTAEGRVLLGVVETPPPPALAQPLAAAIAAYVHARVPSAPAAPALHALVLAYRRDPAIADRLALDLVAQAVDAAVAHAALGALFDALADPARARVAWQAAVASSPEPAHVRGLAETIARARDPDAALVIATTAAASSGDPAPVWIAVARALAGSGEYQHALEAARMALDLAAVDQLDDALDVAIAASDAFGRRAQADALRLARSRLAPPLAPPRDGDPTDAAGALAAHRAAPSAATVARLWVASRWNPRDAATRAALLEAIAADDPRRATLVAELVTLAGDPDAERGRAAAAALRR